MFYLDYARLDNDKEIGNCISIQKLVSRDNVIISGSIDTYYCIVYLCSQKSINYIHYYVRLFIQQNQSPVVFKLGWDPIRNFCHI